MAVPRSKFFGQPNGVEAKKQQSTLAFKNSQTAKNKSSKAPNGKPVLKHADQPLKDNVDAQGVKDEQDDVKMVDGQTEETKAKPDRGESKEESDDGSGGELVKDGLSNGGSLSTLSSVAIPPYQSPTTNVMSLHLDDTSTERPKRASSIAKSPGKRLSSKVKEEEEIDEEVDDEPVKKRPRRGEAQKGSKPATKKSAALQPRESSESTKHKSISETMSKVAKPRSEETTPLGKAEKSRPKGKVKKSESAPSTDEEKLNETLSPKPTKAVQTLGEEEEAVQEADEDGDSEEDEKPEIAAKAREKVQSTLKSHGKDPYPDWKPGEPVPYAALCMTFSLVEMTSKRLIISAHCSLFLRQVLRLTPEDLLPTVLLMINKLAADYAGIELGIGESLIMKAIGESTGRSLATIKADQNEIGDLGLVAAKSRSNQPTMFKPKALTVRGVLDGLMGIATVQGDGSQTRKVAGIKKLLSAADAAIAGKGSKGVDITKDKGGASEAKFIVRFLEGKLRLGLAEKTVLVALAHAMVIHETEKKGTKVPSSEQLAKGESILKTVYR